MKTKTFLNSVEHFLCYNYAGPSGSVTQTCPQAVLVNLYCTICDMIREKLKLGALSLINCPALIFTVKFVFFNTERVEQMNRRIELCHCTGYNEIVKHKASFFADVLFFIANCFIFFLNIPNISFSFSMNSFLSSQVNK